MATSRERENRVGRGYGGGRKVRFTGGAEVGRKMRGRMWKRGVGERERERGR